MRKISRQHVGLAIGWGIPLIACIGLLLLWESKIWAVRDLIAEGARAYCEQPDDCTRQDLPAQVRMADATETLVDVSIIQLALSILGVAFIGWTLIHTSRQASSAVEAVRVADRTAHHQLRAYVNMTHADLRTFEGGKRIAALVTLRNTGQTPAYQVTTRYGVWFGPVSAGEAFQPTFPPEMPVAIGVLAAGGEQYLPVESDAPIEKWQLQELAAGRGVLWIYGEAHYLDVFQAPHVTQFRLTYAGFRNGVHTVAQALTGNHST